LQKLKRRQNTKIIAETEQKYQIAETEEKIKYQNNCRDRLKYQIAEAEGQSKYQILQKRKTKYNSKFFFLQKLNSNTKLQKLKRRRNTKTIAETEQKYQIAEADTKLQKLKRR
jgi:lipocalin